MLERVKPERDAKAHSKDGAGHTRQWWPHGKPRPELRKVLSGLPRFIAKAATAKRRIFQLLDASTAPDNMLVCIAQDDAYHLGCCHHPCMAWALAAGGTLEDRPRHNKPRCFGTSPFPDPSPERQASTLALPEERDSHRRCVLIGRGRNDSQQAAHAELTLTGVCNVL